MHTIMDANFERNFLEMENHLAQLIELLATEANANINQKYHDVVGILDSSSSSNRVPFKVETKVDNPTFGGEVYVEKVNNWLKQLEVYFQIHGVVNDVDKISFVRLNMSEHALVWWEIHVETLNHEYLSEISSLNEFKELLRDQFYPLGHQNKQLMKCQFFRQQRGENVQEYTTKFRK